MPTLRNLRSPSFAVALAALVVALGGSAIAAGEISGSDTPETVLKVRVTKDGKLIGTHNDGTVKKAGVGIYDITFSTGPTGGKVPLDLDDCAIVATPRWRAYSHRRAIERASGAEIGWSTWDLSRFMGASPRW